MLDIHERRNYNAYGLLISDAFANISDIVSTPELGPRKVYPDYQPTDLGLLADQIDETMDKLMSESPDIQRRIEAVSYRYILYLSTQYKTRGFPQLTNSFTKISEVIQEHTREGEPIPGKYGLSASRARALTTEGLRLIAHSIYKNPNTRQYFKLGYPSYLI